MSHVRIGRVDRHHVIDVLYGNRERLPASLTLAYQERRRLDDGSECRTMRELLGLLSYLVGLDAVFVAGVAAA